MTDLPKLKATSRLVVVLMGLGLVVMLGVSLKERITNPHITVQIPEPRPQASAASGTAADSIGALMQEVGQHPDDPHRIGHLVEALMQVQNWEAAEIFARRAVELEADNPQSLYLLGVILHNRDKHAEAADLLEKVIKLKDEPTVRYSLGVLYIHYVKNAALGIEHLTAGLNDPAASEELKAAIRKELEKAPLPEAAAGANTAAQPATGDGGKESRTDTGKESQKPAASGKGGTQKK